MLRRVRMFKRLRSCLLLIAFLPLVSGGQLVQVAPVPTSVAPVTRPLATYTNPLPIKGADPFVLLTGGKFYLYATSAGNGFRVWSSDDLVHWTAHDLCFRRTPTSWGQKKFWAPEVVEKDGQFLLHYTSEGIINGKPTLRLCVARSASPLGPFVDVAAPLIDFGCAMIDGNVFRDTSGKAYLYYSLDCSENRRNEKPISEIYVLPLNDDLISVPSDARPTFIMRPDQRWEGAQWTEGPEVFRRGDTYFMTYSGNFYAGRDYGLGYATAKSPLGPWTKAKTPILRATADVSGPGHNSVLTLPDGSLWCIYHRHEDPAHPSGKRVICIDPMEVLTDATGGMSLVIHGPSTSPSPAPCTQPSAHAP